MIMRKLFFAILFGTFSMISYSQSLSNDTIHWIDYRKLTWNDFKGDSIDLPGMTGQTLIVILANYQKPNLLFPTRTFV